MKICHLQKSLILLVTGYWLLVTIVFAWEAKDGPMSVNGDIIEYSTTGKEISISGNVEVEYKGAKLTCQKIVIDSQTKDAVAEGNARLDDQKGVIEGEKIVYNFQNKTGIIYNSEFRANPYFGVSKKIEKVSDTEFISQRGYITTCDFDVPHWRIKSRKVNFFPQDKVQAKDTTLYIGKIPLLYLPQFNRDFSDPLMHIQMTPGKRKDWGPYLLTATRYNLTKNINGRFYLDYREKLGLAQGFGTNYTTEGFGKGDLKFYYTQERANGLSEASPAEFQRYLLRLRHKWDIDRRTNMVAEFYKINDEKRKILGPSNDFLKDYFYREFEKDAQPLTYISVHHNFQYSSLDVLMQERVNHWYDQLDKNPELKYNLPNIQIAGTPFYFENNSVLSNFNKKASASPVSLDDETVARLDTTNKFSLPSKVAFIELTPFVASRQTIYDKGADGSSFPVRTIFYTGTSASTKFYRVFDAKSNFLNLDINSLRHIITPTISYSYNHEPTISISHIKQIDSIDSISRNNSLLLELSNKLQTKRNDKSVDLAEIKASSTYIFDSKTGDKRGSNFSDILFDVRLMPYSWVTFDADATLKHSGARSDPNYGRLSNINYDINFNFGKERSFSLGQRCQRKGSDGVVSDFEWRINPKWKFSIYNRYEIGHDPSLKSGLKEQEYGITRDLHCWFMDFKYNVSSKHGETVWLIFRLKAFPKTEFGLDQSYHQPKPGSQSTD